MNLPLVWIDLEMTGLDPEVDVILEIAVIITDGSLEETIEGPDLVLHADEAALEEMAPVVREMHHLSGLTEAVRRSPLSAARAEQLVLEFVKFHIPEPGHAPLAGNSVHADRAFLHKHMPELAAWFHYRNVDVSTIKELARRWNPGVLEKAPDKGGGHRALADIRESIAELKYYRENVFKKPDG
ncbi:MAG: oligoribonuclease [Acidimicrobiia bacterium]|nr:oligoribonuclease [Acidimicrobiia bacterium]MDH3396528.1 oligoribonuclease [Acidimicrobiia bacterium]